MSFDPHKPFQTRDGRKARLLDYSPQLMRYVPITAAIYDEALQREVVQCYTADGRTGLDGEGGWDLINTSEDE